MCATVENFIGVEDMRLQALSSPRFIRKTQLGANEYHKNFHKVDAETISVITSVEADKVTPLMSKIYLRLTNASAEVWEREGVLRFESKEREGKIIKAWTLLCELLGVASATANKALTWMHEVGVIGYYAGKNGVGIRIFLNRAESSIGIRPALPSKKILQFTPTSSRNAPASQNETAFNDSFAVSETLDKDIEPSAPKNGANEKQVGKNGFPPTPLPQLGIDTATQTPTQAGPVKTQPTTNRNASTFSLTEVLERLKTEIEPGLQRAAAQAASQATKQEIERTREWFETKAMPKATRVAIHECFSLLKKHGTLDEKTNRTKTDMQIGHYDPQMQSEPLRARTESEIRETAEICLTLLELQGQSIDRTLSEISSEAGGWLLPDDAPKVRELAYRLLETKQGREGAK